MNIQDLYFAGRYDSERATRVLFRVKTDTEVEHYIVCKIRNPAGLYSIKMFGVSKGCLGQVTRHWNTKLSNPPFTDNLIANASVEIVVVLTALGCMEKNPT
jgi:hypothetical protein